MRSADPPLKSASRKHVKALQGRRSRVGLTPAPPLMGPGVVRPFGLGLAAIGALCSAPENRVGSAAPPQKLAPQGKG